MLHGNVFHGHAGSVGQLARKSLANRDDSIGFRQRPAIESVVKTHLWIGRGIAVMKGHPGKLLPQMRPQQKKMRLHGMSDNDVGPMLLYDLAQRRNYFQIETSALGDD